MITGRSINRINSILVHLNDIKEKEELRLQMKEIHIPDPICDDADLFDKDKLEEELQELTEVIGKLQDLVG
jgi:hypothetical protein